MTGEAASSLSEIRVFDGVGPFLIFWDQAAAMPPERVAGAWRSRYHDHLPAEVQRALERHPFPGDLSLAIPRFATGHGAVGERADAVRGAIATSTHRVSSQMAARLGPFRVTTLVGLFCADGWMEWQDDTAHLLVPVEALESIEQAIILVQHELPHVAHQQPADGGIHDVGDALFEEGLATAVPGIGTALDGATLCWVGRRTTPTGEPVANWPARCEATWPAIRSRLLSDFAPTTDEAYGAIFGGDESVGIPVKAGYYAGLCLVRTLLEQDSLTTIARWDRDTARRKTRAVLSRL